MAQKKFLILRFSSFGDVTQCLSVPSKIAEYEPQAVIHWAVRQDLSSLLQNHPHIQKTWALPRKSGLREIWHLAQELKKENFTHIYDAHNSTRSLIISFLLKISNGKVQLLRKSQKRWKRFLLFKLRKNTYRMPFNGQRDLLEPLQKWGMSETAPPPPQLFITSNELESVRKFIPPQPYITLAPSAAYALKRWPLEYWKKLVELSSTESFVILGGPEDQFVEEIRSVDPNRIFNLAGKTNLRETSAVVKLSKLLITNDTGILHTAEQQGHPAIALMGPAPFGFPSRPSTLILERQLSCRPCSKHGQGPCINSNFHECLRSIEPSEVYQHLQEKLK